MKFLVEILNGSSFEIEVDYKDTLLEVKQKIEKSQRIPVSKQTLIVDGAYILREDLNVEQCQIVHDSQLQLDVSADDNYNHYNDDQIPQTEQSSSPWISVEEYFERQGWPLTAEEIRKIYSYRPETTQEKIINKNHQVLHQTEPAPPSNSVKETVNIQDSSVKVGSNNNNNTKKLRVMVLPHCGTRKIPMEVNARDNFGELRKELVKIQQRFELSLPQESYFFIHKQNVMDDDRSFRWHRVDHGDTIEIFPGSVSGGS